MHYHTKFKCNLESNIDINVIINGKILEKISKLNISMLLTSTLEKLLLIACEYLSDIFDFIIISKEKNQLLIKTINYCNENNINKKEVNIL